MDVLEILTLNHMISMEAEKDEEGDKDEIKKSILVGQN